MPLTKKDKEWIRYGMRVIMQETPDSPLKEIMEGFVVTAGQDLSQEQLDEAYKIISEEYNRRFN